MDRHRVGIVIPALNEASTIGAVIEGVIGQGIPIVVDDNSDDDTASVAIEAGAELVSHATNRGYDGALNSGFDRAAQLGCDYVVTLDADGQHHPHLVARFIDALEQGADMAIGIRDRRQRIGEHLFAFVGRLRWGIDDPLCGLKAYRMQIYNDLGHFDGYRSIGTELAVYAATHGARVTQIPIMVAAREGRPRFGIGWRANRRILRALWLDLRFY